MTLGDDVPRRQERAAAVLRALPKAELHLHLEASLRQETAAELSDRYGRPLPRRGPFSNLTEFVVAYEEARDLIGGLEDLHRVSRELVEDAARDGVVWTEVHLIPPAYAGRLGAEEAVLEAVLDGLAAGASEDSAGAVIVGINRGLGLPAADRSLALALAYNARGVVGLGLARDEANHPAREFEGLFSRAASAGLRVLPHAGEGAGADSVRDCVERLHADRINHGVRAVENPAVVNLLADRRVCLDVCPSSNVSLQVVPSLEEHPLPLLIEAGVPVTLNSDGVLFSQSSALGEYESAYARMGLSLEDLREVALTSIEVSSCPEDRRRNALHRSALP